jgi:hypothetical protein
MINWFFVAASDGLVSDTLHPTAKIIETATQINRFMTMASSNQLGRCGLSTASCSFFPEVLSPHRTLKKTSR